jgi:hypothetical protein
MAITSINKNFKNKGKDVKYLNKEFSDFRKNLIEFTKTYFPKTYSDFNETSPGMLFIEMSSYIGDVLSYYVDDTYKEGLMRYAQDEQSIIALAQFLGYKVKVTTPSTTTLSVYQIIPSKTEGGTQIPDEKFYLRIRGGMTVESTNGTQFRTTDVVDFSNPFEREIVEYSRNSITGDVELFLVKKYVNAISAQLKEKTISFGDYKAFQHIDIPDIDVIQIYDVRDSNGNKYYEVPYLAQEMVFIDYPNTEQNDPTLSQFRETVPYLLKTIKTPRRYVVKVNPDKTTTIQFGVGDPSANDELLVPNFKNVGLGLPNSISKLGESYDPTNYLKTKSYGTSPSNTTITVQYYTGGGIESNTSVNTINRVTGIQYDDDLQLFNTSERALYQTIKNSVAVDNEINAVGGRGSETLEEIRENAMANFGAQNRAVTSKDYQIRALSLPPKYGGIAKAYAIADGNLDNNSPSSILSSPNSLQEFTDLVMSFVNLPDENTPTVETVKDDIQRFLIGKTSNINEINNPFAVNLYLLGYNSNGNLINLNKAIKQNLKTYLNEYRLLTDGINILDGFIINIGVEFEITVFESYNKSDVVATCIRELTEYFSIDNWSFNNTINISEIELLIGNIEGVSSVSMVKIVNKCGDQYSPNSYNVEAATRGKIIYPSLDPSVFEVKFPGTDIKGRAR